MAIWPFSKGETRPSTRPANDNPPNAHCSFCGRPRKQVGPMVEGPNDVYICVDCVRLAHQIAEANAMQPASADVTDPSVRWAGHMHLRCYFRLQEGADGQWAAIGEHARDLVGNGKSPKDAVRDLQAKVLAMAAESFERAVPVGDHFTNHVDGRLR